MLFKEATVTEFTIKCDRCAKTTPVKELLQRALPLLPPAWAFCNLNVHEPSRAAPKGEIAGVAAIFYTTEAQQSGQHLCRHCAEKFQALIQQFFVGGE